jgi:hypothetical protein
VGGLENRPGVPYSKLKWKDTRTEAQKKALAKYVKDFHRKHPTIPIVGHRDLPGVSKECPCFDVASWLREIGIK